MRKAEYNRLVRSCWGTFANIARKWTQCGRISLLYDRRAWNSAIFLLVCGGVNAVNGRQTKKKKERRKKSNTTKPWCKWTRQSICGRQKGLFAYLRTISESGVLSIAGAHTKSSVGCFFYTFNFFLISFSFFAQSLPSIRFCSITFSNFVVISLFFRAFSLLFFLIKLFSGGHTKNTKISSFEQFSYGAEKTFLYDSTKHQAIESNNNK